MIDARAGVEELHDEPVGARLVHELDLPALDDHGDLRGGAAEVGSEQQGAALLIGEGGQRSAQVLALDDARVLVLQGSGVMRLELRRQQLRIERLGLPEAHAIDRHVPDDRQQPGEITVPRRAS
jgi:hypothetical protein